MTRSHTLYPAVVAAASPPSLLVLMTVMVMMYMYITTRQRLLCMASTPHVVTLDSPPARISACELYPPIGHICSQF